MYIFNESSPHYIYDATNPSRQFSIKWSMMSPNDARKYNLQRQHEGLPGRWIQSEALADEKKA